MVKSSKPSYNVSGKSIQDIINMDNKTFNKLTDTELRKVVGRLVSAGNKRLRSFQRAGEQSPASRYVMKHGGMFSTKGKTLNQLRAEYRRASNFLKAETGTRRGWDKVKKKAIASLKKRGVVMTEEQWDDVWETYEDLKELSPSVSTKNLKYASLKDIADQITETNKSAEEIAIELHEQIANIYEEQERKDNDRGVSEFFEI